MKIVQEKSPSPVTISNGNLYLDNIFFQFISSDFDFSSSTPLSSPHEGAGDHAGEDWSSKMK